MITAVKALTQSEQGRRDLVAQSNGLLKECWLQGYLWRVTDTAGNGLTIYSHNPRLYSRPYKVCWQADADRWVRGELKPAMVDRSRSFKHLDSMLKFISEF